MPLHRRSYDVFRRYTVDHATIALPSALDLDLFWPTRTNRSRFWPVTAL